MQNDPTASMNKLNISEQPKNSNEWFRDECLHLEPAIKKWVHINYLNSSRKARGRNPQEHLNIVLIWMLCYLGN